LRIIFLGTAGGRKVTFYQLRASGGFLIESKDKKIHIDPGPGALIRLIQCGIDPTSIDIIVITHRHLDHCADVNTIIEARTMGGWNKGGMLFAPKDALNGKDPVVLHYHRKNLDKIETITPSWELSLSNLKLKAIWPHLHHGVETYGLVIEEDEIKIGYITDGRWEEEIGKEFRKMNILIINTTFAKPRDMDHLCVDDVSAILKEAKPAAAFITHFSMEMLGKTADEAAESLSSATGVNVIAAKDFMEVEIEKIKGETKIKSEIMDLAYPFGLKGTK